LVVNSYYFEIHRLITLYK